MRGALMDICDVKLDAHSSCPAQKRKASWAFSGIGFREGTIFSEPGFGKVQSSRNRGSGRYSLPGIGVREGTVFPESGVGKVQSSRNRVLRRSVSLFAGVSPSLYP